MDEAHVWYRGLACEAGEVGGEGGARDGAEGDRVDWAAEVVGEWGFAGDKADEGVDVGTIVVV